MQALKNENTLAFCRTIGGVANGAEISRRDMKCAFYQEILAREFVVSVVKEKLEEWARDTFICSKNKIYIGCNDDKTLYYFTSGNSIAVSIDIRYDASILHTAYNIAREYGLCVTCIYRNGTAIYEFWIDSK